MPDHCIPKCEENSSIFNLMPWTITAMRPRIIFKPCPKKMITVEIKPPKILLNPNLKAISLKLLATATVAYPTANNLK